MPTHPHRPYHPLMKCRFFYICRVSVAHPKWRRCGWIRGWMLSSTTTWTRTFTHSPMRITISYNLPQKNALWQYQTKLHPARLTSAQQLVASCCGTAMIHGGSQLSAPLAGNRTARKLQSFSPKVKKFLTFRLFIFLRKKSKNQKVFDFSGATFRKKHKVTKVLSFRLFDFFDLSSVFSQKIKKCPIFRLFDFLNSRIFIFWT